MGRCADTPKDCEACWDQQGQKHPFLHPSGLKGGDRGRESGAGARKAGIGGEGCSVAGVDSDKPLSDRERAGAEIPQPEKTLQLIFIRKEKSLSGVR